MRTNHRTRCTMQLCLTCVNANAQCGKLGHCWILLCIFPIIIFFPCFDDQIKVFFPIFLRKRLSTRFIECTTVISRFLCSLFSSCWWQQTFSRIYVAYFWTTMYRWCSFSVILNMYNSSLFFAALKSHQHSSKIIHNQIRYKITKNKSVVSSKTTKYMPN